MKKFLSILLLAAITISLIPASLTAGAEESIMYSDVAEKYWAYENIQECTEEGWLEGYPDGSFAPERGMTRAEAAKTVVLFSERKPAKIGNTYKDVEADAWYAPYVYAAEAFLPVAWKVSSRIEPEKAVTREELVYMIVYAMGYDSELGFANRFLVDNAFSDNAAVSETLKPLFSLAVSKGIISGYSDGTLKPQGMVTRAQMAAMLCRTADIPEKHALRDAFCEKFNVVETNVMGTENGLLLQTNDDYFDFETTVPTDGYYDIAMGYAHDSWELYFKITVTYPDGRANIDDYSAVAGEVEFTAPIWLEKGKNLVRIRHAQTKKPVWSLPFEISYIENRGKTGMLPYRISPTKVTFFLDAPKTPQSLITNYKDKLVKIETTDGVELPFTTELMGDRLVTESMIRVYPDKEIVSKLPEGTHTLKYTLENGKVLTQEINVLETAPETGLEYINFNVGKANSTLIKLPNGKNMLIDSGYDANAKDEIIPYLEKHNIKLDYYLLTHFHTDHWGMKDEILEMNGIKKPDQDKADALVKADKQERYDYLKDFGYLDSTMLCYYDELHEIWDLGGVTMDVLNSRFDENGEAMEVYNYPFYRINEHNYENSTSVSFMLDYNGFRYYHGADNYAFAQERYMYDMIKQKRTDELSCDWFFGNHHFICDISPQFIITLNPKVVFIPNDKVYHRSQYTTYYKKYVEDYNFYNKQLAETIVSGDIGSARVCVNSKDDWYYEIISDGDMYN
ncbi:MAG: MBL fold metallo-hydrolase [Ruminococcaceae bacterium]|nr:MBL fold metallo-hydrolase [Oscillospiraceae bacterium]